MTQQDSLMTALMDRYGIDSDKADDVLAYAKRLSMQDDHSNDYALAKCLNDHAISLFKLITGNTGNLDIAAINKSYVLIVNELKTLYARNPELEKISEHICWKQFNRLESIDDELWNYVQYGNNDYGQSHNAEVNMLCITNNKQTPDLEPRIKKIVNEATVNHDTFVAELEKLNDKEPHWFIPEYKLVYKIDGSIVINDVLTVKKTQPGLASDKLMNQAIKNEGKLFKPDLGQNYSRNITTTLSGMGFKKNEALQELFFPTATNSGIVFRSHVSRDEAIAGRINTRKLDVELQKHGALIEEKPFDLNDIPF